MGVDRIGHLQSHGEWLVATPRPWRWLANTPKLVVGGGEPLQAMGVATSHPQPEPVEKEEEEEKKE